MPRVDAVASRRVQPIQLARRASEARARAYAINQSSEQARKEISRKAAEQLKLRTSLGSNLDLQA